MLWRDGERLTTGRDEVDLTRTAAGGPAIYRAAIVAPPELGSIPWVISNPIYVGVSFPRPARSLRVRRNPSTSNPPFAASRG